MCGQFGLSAAAAEAVFPQHAALICLLLVWVPLRFSGSVLSSVSLSSLLPHHAQFHLAQPPPLESARSSGFIDGGWCIVQLGYCMTRTVPQWPLLNQCTSVIS